MKIKKGEKIPFGYGYAWANYTTLTFEFFPIPLNIILRNLRKFYFWLVSSKRDDEFLRAFKKGWEIGNKQGEQSSKLVWEDFLKRTYIRAKDKNEKWGSFSLIELIEMGQEKQALDWLRKLK